jgi:hypothetical protein
VPDFRYYSYENLDSGEWQGLLRFAPSDANYSYAKNGQWLAGDPERMKMFFFPGADAPDLIGHDLTEKLAARYGVSLTE